VIQGQLDVTYSLLVEDNLVDLYTVLDWTLPQDDVVTILGERHVGGVEGVREELVQASPVLWALKPWG
jgi:hypothetical protein